jgi:hypothetical protein
MKFSPYRTYFIFIPLISSCKQHQEARPISQTSGSFMKNQWKEIKN